MEGIQLSIASNRNNFLQLGDSSMIPIPKDCSLDKTPNQSRMYNKSSRQNNSPKVKKIDDTKFNAYLNTIVNDQVSHPLNGRTSVDNLAFSVPK